MHIDHNIEPISIVDKSILYFSEIKSNKIYSVFEDAGFSEEVINENDLDRKMHQAILTLERLRYIEHIGNDGDLFTLTDLGRQVKKAGGHFAYLKKLEGKAIIETERQERKDKADKLDLLLKQWQVKTKLLPYIVSIFALVVSIASYYKPEKKQQDLQQMEETIKELQDNVRALDSLYRMDTLLKKNK